MGRKSAGPALYELIKPKAAMAEVTRPPKPPRAPKRLKRSKPKRAPTAGRVRSGWPAWLSPGSRIALPSGYVLVGLAVTVSIVAGAYMYGYERAEKTSEPDSITPSERNRMPGPEVSADGPTMPPPAVVLEATPASVTTPAPPRVAPLFADPRKAGLSYFVIAETNAAGAERLARFCREEGLAAYILGSSSDRFRKVIVLPGFSRAARSSPPVKALEATIHAVGDRWKLRERGASDLRDAYALAFIPN